MNNLLRTTASSVWLALLAATGVSVALVERGFAGVVTVGLVMLIAAFKVRLVFTHFMDLKSTPPPWRMIFDAWIAVCVVTIVGFYAYAPH